MTADAPAGVQLDNISGHGRKILRQKSAEVPFANETDARGVFPLGVGEAGFPGKLAHMAFGQFPEGKTGARKLLLAQYMEKVALILGRIHSF